VLCDKNPIEKPLVSINNESVCVNMIKSSTNGESIIVRIRSFSDKDENVKIDWPTRKPASVFLCKRGEESSDEKVINEVNVPAMGFVTLKAEW